MFLQCTSGDQWGQAILAQGVTARDRSRRAEQFSGVGTGVQVRVCGYSGFTGEGSAGAGSPDYVERNCGEGELL